MTATGLQLFSLGEELSCILADKNSGPQHIAADVFIFALTMPEAFEYRGILAITVRYREVSAGIACNMVEKWSSQFDHSFAAASLNCSFSIKTPKVFVSIEKMLSHKAWISVWHGLCYIY